MWFLITICIFVIGCAIFGRRWIRWIYLHYGRYIIPRSFSLFFQKQNMRTLTLKNNENIEGMLDEGGEMTVTTVSYRCCLSTI